jgi:hypothetical protein
MNLRESCASLPEASKNQEFKSLLKGCHEPSSGEPVVKGSARPSAHGPAIGGPRSEAQKGTPIEANPCAWRKKGRAGEALPDRCAP